MIQAKQSKRKTVDCKIAIRFFDGDTSVLTYWKDVLEANGTVISNTKIMRDNRTAGYSVCHFELATPLSAEDDESDFD